jgi:hypothetical protein
MYTWLVDLFLGKVVFYSFILLSWLLFQASSFRNLAWLSQSEALLL